MAEANKDSSRLANLVMLTCSFGCLVCQVGAIGLKNKIQQSRKRSLGKGRSVCLCLDCCPRIPDLDKWQNGWREKRTLYFCLTLFCF